MNKNPTIPKDISQSIQSLVVEDHKVEFVPYESRFYSRRKDPFKAFQEDDDGTKIYQEAVDETVQHRAKEIANDNDTLAAETFSELEREVRQETEARLKFNDLTSKVAVGLNPKEILSQTLQQMFVWGPYNEFLLIEKLLWKNRGAVEEHGGLEGYAMSHFLQKIRHTLDQVFTEGKERAELFRTLMTICYDEEFTEFDWLLDQISKGNVAVVSDGFLKFFADGAVHLQGHGFDHPWIGGIREARPSSSDPDRVYTSAVVKVWPKRTIVRTMSRFYLLPNGVAERSEIDDILAAVDVEDILKLQKHFELEQWRAFDDADQYSDLVKSLQDRHKSETSTQILGIKDVPTNGHAN